MGAAAGQGLRALVIDDEENISYLVVSALTNSGFEAKSAATGADGVYLARSFNPHVVILDVMLPDADGTEVVKRLRETAVTAPVIFLSARGTTDDRVRGLTAGGDDYMVKPFALEELLARVHAQVRRSGAGAGPTMLEVADLVMDTEAHRVWRAGDEISLSGTEFALLRFLMMNAGKVLTRPQILDHVWQYDFGGDGAIIETYVSHLRRKMDQSNPRLIHTVRGIGYSLRPPR
ncbi:MAG: response regulator transcription factor [Ilumatobacteraceae bacterium]